MIVVACTISCVVKRENFSSTDQTKSASVINFHHQITEMKNSQNEWEIAKLHKVAQRSHTQHDHFQMVNFVNSIDALLFSRYLSSVPYHVFGY